MQAIQFYIQLFLSYFSLPFLLFLISYALVSAFFLQKKKDGGRIWLLSLCILIIYYFSVYTRSTIAGNIIRPFPFWSYIESFQSHNFYLFVQNGINIFIFIPIGFIGASLWKNRKKALLFGLLFCLFIETSQLILHNGFFDVDDILHNTIGCFLGYTFYNFIKKKYENPFYEVNTYSFGKKGIKIALIADLHEFKQDGLLIKIKQQQPDYIFIAGDVLERRGRKHTTKEEYVGNWFLYRFAWFLDDCLEFMIGTQDRLSEYSYSFLEEAVKVAPVICSRGNHEKHLEERDIEFFNQHHILFLDNQDIELTDSILVGGCCDNFNEEWLSSFSKKEGYKILLCHRPEYYKKYMMKYSFDLVCAGHAHGGQIRVLNQGLFSPGQGLFPKWTKGLYFDHLLVTSGCSNTSYIPRLHNPRELVMIEL